MNKLIKLTVNDKDAFVNLAHFTHAVYLGSDFVLHFTGGAPLVISKTVEKNAAENKLEAAQAAS